MALIHALIAATSHAIKWRWNKLTNMRWNKDEGFHSKKSSNDSVFGSEVAPTIFSTRIQQKTHINPLLFTRNKSLRKFTVIAGLLLIGWCILSVALNTTFSQKIHHLPKILTSATSATASLFISPRPAVVNKSAQNSLTATSKNNAQSSSLVAVTTGVAQSSQQSSQQVSSQASSLDLPTYALTIKVTPEDARIRLLNIPEKYKDGINVVSGRYHIEIAKTGYKTKTEWIDIKNEPLNMSTFKSSAFPIDE
ncbi:MAG: hypothetical protein EOO68_08720 [Moraxellaceae bacterium]|nr:MAG: hypothetical protein EOO68_08720 [Moraxellaceae bacterium]